MKFGQVKQMKNLYQANEYYEEWRARRENTISYQYKILVRHIKGDIKRWILKKLQQQ